MEFWIKATLILCSYGFFKEMKPSEPFLTPYLKAQKNMTEEDLEKIYPVWTYSYLLTLLVVFLVTGLLRYKPVIIIEGLAYLATRILLIWAGGVLAMQFMQFVYGVATGAEVAYYSYIYAVVDRDHYKIVTSYTRAAVLLGRLISGVVGQLLITFKVTDYLVLNYISLGSVSISCILTLLLPKASGNVFITTTESDYLIEEQRNGCISSWKRTMITMFRDFKLCYSDKELLRWSLWWAFATGGEFQVENYVQNLWEIIYPSHNHKIYNGGVTAISHLTGSLVAIALAHVKINWSIFGELCLGVVSVADAFFLFQSAHTSNIWLAYLMYVLFRTAYTFLITIASLQIAKHVEMSRFALVFGINMFAALLVSTILTAVVVDGPDLKLSVIEQFVIYGSYFVIIGAVFLARAVYHITRVGWRQSWQQRYVEMEAQPLEDVRNRDSQEDCTGELVAPNTGGLVIT